MRFHEHSRTLNGLLRIGSANFALSGVLALSLNARAEAFLAQNLGGRAEPVHGDKYPGSTAVVKVVGK